MLAIRPGGFKALHKIYHDLPRLVSDAGAKFLHATYIQFDSNSGGIENALVDHRTNVGDEEKEDENNDGYNSLLIRWSALQNVLASFVNPNNVVTGHSLHSFTENVDNNDDGEYPVRLIFENGHVVKCRALIACDGLFSKVRKQMYPENDPVIFFGQLNWNSIIPTDFLSDEFKSLKNTITCAVCVKEDPKWSSFINDCGKNHIFWQFRLTDPKKAKSVSGSKGRGGLGLPSNW